MKVKIPAYLEAQIVRFRYRENEKMGTANSSSTIYIQRTTQRKQPVFTFLPIDGASNEPLKYDCRTA